MHLGKSITSEHALCLALAVFLAGLSTGTAAPTAPSGLLVTTGSTTRLDLSWNDNSSNEQGFRIDQSSDSITFTTIATNGSNVITYAATNLSPAIKYYFRVRSFNSTGNSAYSNTNSATTRTPWAQWRLDNFTAGQATNETVSGLSADPDGDGSANAVEYGLGREPLSADTARPATAGVDSFQLTNFATLVYTSSVTAIDVQFAARVSSDLSTWSSDTNLLEGPAAIATNSGLVTMKFSVRSPLSVGAARYLRLDATYTGVSNSWETGPPMPANMVEMGAVWLGDKLYVTGMTNALYPDTSTLQFVYNLNSNSWSQWTPMRPYPGSHPTMFNIGGLIYIVGGFDGGSSGKVQIFNPTNSTWSLGASMPWAAGAFSAEVINGKIYAAGGIVGEVTSNGYWTPGHSTNLAAVYDPVSNVWTNLPPQPADRNHTASGTDGSRFFIFGGRNIGDTQGNGFNTVQIYDPSNNTWDCSTNAGSTLAPLPAARGGMGKAIYHNGDFFVMGGETVSDPGATANLVFNRVDIYNVVSNSWRLGTPMPTALHGIYPALRGNRIYVAGGGPHSSGYYSSLFEIYILP